MSGLTILGVIFVIIALVIIFYWIHCHLSSWGFGKSSGCGGKCSSKGGSCGGGTKLVVQSLQGEDCEDPEQIGQSRAIHIEGGTGTILVAIDDPSRLRIVRPVSICDGENQGYYHGQQQLQM